MMPCSVHNDRVITQGGLVGPTGGINDCIGVRISGVPVDGPSCSIIFADEIIIITSGTIVFDPERNRDRVVDGVNSGIRFGGLYLSADAQINTPANSSTGRKPCSGAC